MKTEEKQQIASIQISNMKTKDKTNQTDLAIHIKTLTLERQTSTNSPTEMDAALENFTKVLESPPFPTLSEPTTPPTKQTTVEQTPYAGEMLEKIKKNRKRLPPDIRQKITQKTTS